VPNTFDVLYQVIYLTEATVGVSMECADQRIEALRACEGAEHRMCLHLLPKLAADVVSEAQLEAHFAEDTDEVVGDGEAILAAAEKSLAYN
jgi:hypothetical protein